MSRVTIAALKDRLRGHWRAILLGLGVPAESLDAQREHPCPKCGGVTRFTAFKDFDETGSVFCRHCHANGGDGIDTVMWLKDVDLETALEQLSIEAGMDRNTATGIANWPPEGGQLSTSVTRADSSTLHQAYSLWLEGLSLTTKHCQQLRLRGLSDDDIQRARYRSVTPVKPVALARQLQEQLGPEYDRIPGFNRDPANPFLIPAGLAIPVRDVAQQIVGIRIRRDRYRGEQGKYCWMSSSSRGGPAGEAHPHVPLWSGPSPRVVRFTEGELKADVASRLSGVLTLSMPGVQCWKRLLPVVRELRAETVLLAFDADAATNVAVARALRDCWRALCEAELEVKLETWSVSDGKGIDDLLVAGLVPTMHGGDLVLQEIGRLVAAAESLAGPALHGSRTSSGAVVDDARKCSSIAVDPNRPVLEVMDEITVRLDQSGRFFSRTGQLVLIHDNVTWPILTPAQLAGALNPFVEFMYREGRARGFRPLSTSYASVWLNNPEQSVKLPPLKLFTRTPTFTDDLRLVEPGYDRASGIYYAGPVIQPRDSTDCLDTLLRDFCFRRPADRTNYVGILLTSLLGPKFVGSKPALLLNGNQPELGKSMLAQIVALLRDGRTVETATYNANDEEFEKRVGALVRDGFTTLIIDNAKARGRSATIESAMLERCLTDPILSFRLLGSSTSIRAENSHQVVITANCLEVSPDLIKRSLTSNLFYEGNPTKRAFSVQNPEAYVQANRHRLLGELIGMVERWKVAGQPLATTKTRFNKQGWGDMIGGILQVCGQPDFLANQAEVAEEMNVERRQFAELVALLADHPQGIWSASELADYTQRQGLFAGCLEGTAKSRATRMGNLAGRFLRDTFPLDGDRIATFGSEHGADGKTRCYRVTITGGEA